MSSEIRSSCRYPIVYRVTPPSVHQMILRLEKKGLTLPENALFGFHLWHKVNDVI